MPRVGTITVRRFVEGLARGRSNRSEAIEYSDRLQQKLSCPLAGGRLVIPRWTVEVTES